MAQRNQRNQKSILMVPNGQSVANKRRNQPKMSGEKNTDRPVDCLGFNSILFSLLVIRVATYYQRTS